MKKLLASTVVVFITSAVSLAAFNHYVSFVDYLLLIFVTNIYLNQKEN